MSEPVTEARRTAPLSVAIGALGSISNGILPALAIAFSGIGGPGRYLLALGVGLAAIGIGIVSSYVGWRRLTYTVGAEDIRVESGILSRTARSVPFERIQDVSLEQKLLPRLFGLVSVKFETGAGGGEDMSLAYLTAPEGEALRQLVRERRDSETAPQSSADVDIGAAPLTADDPEARELFAMNPRRLATFGTFEFSLAVFAVLAGLTQYVETVAAIELWDPDLWESWLKGSGDVIARMGIFAQIIGVIAGLIAIMIIGFATGIARTFMREWGFLLEHTARGFRRRRGLFTRTDVVMPVHRVQGIEIGTRVLRYRFGWHSLRFISLAQDAGAANHDVAPFAKMEEIAPIVEAAGFHLPAPDADWHRADPAYKADSVMVDGGLFALGGVAAVAASIVMDAPGPLFVALGLFALAVFGAGAALYSWTFKRHTLDATQIIARSGLLSPQVQIATRHKLHSVELAQGPLARLRGYATIKLGLAGGTFEIPGVPLERAREVRRLCLQTITATDFSQLGQD